MSKWGQIRQVTALGLTTRKGRQVTKQTFSRLFRNPFYCGWIEKDGTRVKGTHEPLITEEVFNAVQQRLNPGVPHRIERDDFPLRGFMRCSKCDKALTAGWVKGRSKSYSRYWCFTKGCKGVSVSAEELETRLHRLFKDIQPEAHLLAKLPIIAARSWDARKERIALDAKALRRRLEDQEGLNRQPIEARVRGTEKLTQECIERSYKPRMAERAVQTESVQATAFVDLLKAKQTRKGDFAQRVAHLIEADEAFQVPDYLAQAIRRVAEHFLTQG